VRLDDFDMPRISWAAISERAETWHKILAIVPLEAGAPAHQADGLRDAVGLALRACSRLACTGRYAATPVRAGLAGALVVFERAEDREAFARLVPSAVAKGASWQFTLDDPTIDALETFARPKDTRGTGRRARERTEAAERERGTLRWKTGPTRNRRDD
jgi:hypothetical protein